MNDFSTLFLSLFYNIRIYSDTSFTTNNQSLDVLFTGHSSCISNLSPWRCWAIMISIFYYPFNLDKQFKNTFINTFIWSWPVRMFLATQAFSMWPAPPPFFPTTTSTNTIIVLGPLPCTVFVLTKRNIVENCIKTLEILFYPKKLTIYVFDKLNVGDVLKHAPKVRGHKLMSCQHLYLWTISTSVCQNEKWMHLILRNVKILNLCDKIQYESCT